MEKLHYIAINKNTPTVEGTPLAIEVIVPMKHGESSLVLRSMVGALMYGGYELFLSDGINGRRNEIQQGLKVLGIKTQVVSPSHKPDYLQLVD